MQKTNAWNVQSATSQEELANVLFAAASGIKTQVLVSPVLADPRHATLKKRLDEIADELHGLQQDAFGLGQNI